MGIEIDIRLCLLTTENGGLVKVQHSGTRSLYFHFGWAGVEIDFGGFLDLENNIDVEPGIGPVTGLFVPFAAEASQIQPGQAFTIRYPKRIIGYGFVQAVHGKYEN